MRLFAVSIPSTHPPTRYFTSEAAKQVLSTSCSATTSAIKARNAAAAQALHAADSSPPPAPSRGGFNSTATSGSGSGAVNDLISFDDDFLMMEPMPSLLVMSRNSAMSAGSTGQGSSSSSANPSNGIDSTVVQPAFVNPAVAIFQKFLEDEF